MTNYVPMLRQSLAILDMNALNHLLIGHMFGSLGGASRLSLRGSHYYILLKHGEVIFLWVHTVALIVDGEPQSTLFLGYFPVYAGVSIPIVVRGSLRTAHITRIMYAKGSTILHAFGDIGAHWVVLVLSFSSIRRVRTCL